VSAQYHKDICGSRCKALLIRDLGTRWG